MDEHSPRSLFEAFLDEMKERLIVVAPFITLDAMRRVLRAVPDGGDITVFTTWPARAVKAGVTDPNIFGPVSDRNGAIHLYANLHGKLYLTGNRGERMLIGLGGSANVTHKGLGWSRRPNLELLLPVTTAMPEVKWFLRGLTNGATDAVDAARVDLAHAEAARLSPEHLLATDDDEPVPVPSADFATFQRRIRQRLASSRDSALAKRWLLHPEDTEGEFIRKCGDGLAIDRFLDLGMAVVARTIASETTVGAAAGPQVETFRSIAPDYDVDVVDAAEDWETLCSWLRLFYPKHFGIREHTEAVLTYNGEF